ncbi:MAG: hypothetical protein JWM23_583 [Microbacteriaceae bacterium]|nr:hypothetical protein [Microbacteriaceae bacterium]
MSDTKIDHLAKSEELLASVAETTNAELKDRRIARAGVHATIALVQQQRIATLIRVLESEENLTGLLWVGNEVEGVRAEIREGLGI